MNNIRPPDKVITEQLCDYDSDYDYEVEQAMHLSRQEFIEQEERQLNYEMEIVKNFEIEKNKRTNNFSKLLFDLNKVGKLDKEVNEIYLIIEPIIYAYCEQIFETCELDKITYDKIFKTLKCVRTDKNSVEMLKTIINSI
jgi:hypothetical protein